MGDAQPLWNKVGCVRAVDGFTTPPSSPGSAVGWRAACCTPKALPVKPLLHFKLKVGKQHLWSRSILRQVLKGTHPPKETWVWRALLGPAGEGKGRSMAMLFFVCCSMTVMLLQTQLLAAAWAKLFLTAEKVTLNSALVLPHPPHFSMMSERSLLVFMLFMLQPAAVWAKKPTKLILCASF